MAPRGLFGSSARKAVEHLGDHLLDDYRAAIPAHVRIFGSTLLGDRSDITANNFSPDEIQAIRNLVAEAERSGKRTVQYGQYKKLRGARDMDYAGVRLGPVHGGIDYGDRDLNAVANTVGQFRFSRTPDGEIVINDSYDWDNTHGGRRPTLDRALQSVFKRGSLEDLGAYLAPDPARGRPIRLEVPPR